MDDNKLAANVAGWVLGTLLFVFVSIGKILFFVIFSLVKICIQNPRIALVWILWIIAGSIGWAISQLIEDNLSYFLGNIIEGIASQFFLYTILGSIIGITEWLSLRLLVNISPKLIIARGLGRGIAYVIVYLLLTNYCVQTLICFVYNEETKSMQLNLFMGILSSLISGLFIGITEWIILRRYFTNSSVWVIFSVIGWVLATIFTFNTSGISGEVISGAIIATITGIGIIYLVNQLSMGQPQNSEKNVR